MEPDVNEEEDVKGDEEELLVWLDTGDELDAEEELEVGDDAPDDVVPTEVKVELEELVVLFRFKAAYPPTITMIITTTTITILAPLLIACRNLDFLDSTK